MRSIGRFLMKNSNDDGVRDINYRFWYHEAQ